MKITSRRRRFHRRLAFPLAPAPPPQAHILTGRPHARSESHPSALSRLSRCLPGAAGADPSHTKAHCAGSSAGRHCGRPVRLCLWRGGGRRQEGMRVQAAQLPHAYRRGEARVARGADAPLSRAPTGLNTRARAHALTHTHYLSLQCRNESQQAATSCSITNRPLLTHWASALRKRGAARRIPPGPAFFSS